MRVIGYLTSGYPSLEGCVRAARDFVTGGCNMLEISIPLENNNEAPYLSELMKTAIANYPNYDEHLESIGKIIDENPNIRITLLLYDEVLRNIGIEKVREFCLSYGIKDINSADIDDCKVIELYEEYGINFAGLLTYTFDEKRLQFAKETKGFIYCQAFPREGQEIMKDCETPEKFIAYIRKEGINNPLYCGGGIRTPEDVIRLKKAGADGFFLGTPILKIIENSQEVVASIRSFSDAIRD